MMEVNAAETGKYLRDSLWKLAEKHPLVRLSLFGAHCIYPAAFCLTSPTLAMADRRYPWARPLRRHRICQVFKLHRKPDSADFVFDIRLLSLTQGSMYERTGNARGICALLKTEG
jgi:hypothetical protein